MSEVAFHFNAANKLQYACRLMRKAYLKGSTLFVLTDPENIDRLDVSLWTMTEDAFIPHALPSDPHGVKSRSRILIGSEIPAKVEAEVLVNLQQEWVGAWSRFSRVVEVVGDEEVDRLAARERWRRYRAEGAEPVHHDLRSLAA